MNTSHSLRRRQRGVASLIVVVVLLAAMAIAISYTSRQLVMEQKTSANQTRSTIAAEAAEAGLEWAAAMLNKPEKVNASCTTSAMAGDVRFKAKYLNVDSSSGAISAKAGSVHAACVWTGSAWSCSCPDAGTAPSLTITPSGSQPGFAVVFSDSSVSGTLRVTSYGCTTAITGTSCGGDGAATASVALGGVSGLATPPAAPLTARGYVSIGNAALGVINGDPSSNGITINAGMSIDADKARITTVPGTPPSASLVGNDPTLRNTSEAQMFATYFGMTKETYKNMPSVKQLSCPCTETDVASAYANGARQMWMNGNLVMNANLTIGAVDDPVILIVDGTIEMRGDLRVFGVIYSTAITWDNTGGGSALLQGAAISEGNYTGNGTPDYFYDTRVLTKLRNDQSSFVRVPGSWRDF